MCLKKVTKLITPQVKIGYKYFYECYKYDEKGNSTPSNEVRNVCRNGRYVLKSWYKDSSLDTIRATDGQRYQSGYHIFTTARGAQYSGYHGAIYKVEYQDVVAEGTEGGRAKIVIAKSMRVLERFVSKVRK